MKLILYGLISSAGILGLFVGFYPQYLYELFLGWSIPAFAGFFTIYFVIDATKKNAQLVTKVLIRGFAIKMFYYAVVILISYKLYAFEPVPFISSFISFCLGLHVLEAVIIKDISQ